MKLNLKLISLMLILLFISVSAVCAEDNAQADDNTETVLSTVNVDETGSDIVNELRANSTEARPTSDLKTMIQRAQAGSTIELDSDYYWDKRIDIQQEITIDGKGHTIDGKNNRIMHIAAKNGVTPSNIVFKNITFINGVDKNGGAIYAPAEAKHITIDSCTFKNCKAKENVGGAVQLKGDNCIITNCYFEGNTAITSGGAIRLEGNSQTVSNNTFKSNIATGADGGAVGGAICSLGHNSKFTYNTFIGNKASRDGGALFAEGTNLQDMCHGVTISNNVFIDNKVTGNKDGSHGGAISMAGEGCTISYNNFTNNHADTIGGAIRWNGANSAMGDIIGNRFNGNDARSGGAIYIDGKGIKITKNVFDKNKVTTGAGGTINIKGDNTAISDNEISNSETQLHGGAIYIEGKNTQLKNNVITKCVAGDKGGGAYLAGSGSITGCTFTSCTAKSYGGAVCFNNDKDFTLGGNTFNNNKAEKGGGNYYPTTIPSGDMPTTVTAKYDKNTKNIVATVKDATGKAVSGLNVGFAGVADKVQYALTDANGQAKYSTSNLAEKKYSVIVRAMNNPGYEDSNKVTLTVDLTKISTSITAPDVTTRYNGGKKLVATLKDANGNAIKGAKVKIVLGNATETLTTDANGQVSMSTDGLDYNTYTATITFDGTDTYKESSATAKVYVTNKEQAKIFLRNALYFVLQTKMVKVSLWDSSNNPLAGKTVRITLNEFNATYSGVTDENGDASIRVGVGFGVHSATVSFDGDDNYTGTSKTGSIRVIKETPSLMLPGKYTKFKATDKIKVVKIFLKDRYDKPLLPGTKVFLKVNGKTYSGLIGLDGGAIINLDINKVGSYTAELIYTGNTAYNGVRKTTKIFIV